MKPKEFDELIRQKFDRNDFAYDPGNWDRLAEKLEGKEKKRNIIAWWWIPLAGMAASVALAFGVSSVIREMTPGTGASIAHVQKKGNAQPDNAQSYDLLQQPSLAQNEADGGYTPLSATTDNATANNTHRHTNTVHKHNTKLSGSNTDDDDYGINLKNATANNVVFHARKIDLTKEVTAAADKKKVAVVEVVSTFKPEEVAAIKPPKVSIILSGGYNHGNQNTGYMAGATVRRMINDKVYVESDVALASSNNTQSTAYLDREISTVNAATASRHASTGRDASSQGGKSSTYSVTTDIIKQKDVSYNLYYAQITPGIGYNVIKKMSIGVGPDFQKLLVDNRPAPSTVDRNNIQVAPTFDVGFIGKTEFALTKKVKAAVYYRKAVNNIITPMDKYIDRDYLQFQIRYTILNK